MSDHDTTREFLLGIRSDLGRIQFAIDRYLKETEQPQRVVDCPSCGPLRLPPTTTLEDHLANVHDIQPAA